MNTGIRLRALVLSGFFVVPALAFAQTAGDWTTPFESYRGMRTATLDDTYNYLNRIVQFAGKKGAARSASFEYGVSPQGRKLIAYFYSKSGALAPETAAKSQLPLVLIQGGIHSGEIDGKDAGMLLAREMVVTGSLANLLDKCNVVFLPVFNIDGHERISKYNRINQDGPEEMGWRTTAQNLNLNRDYLKADAPEMRAWLSIVNAANPDIIVDCHVTDGMDFQYNTTYSMEMFGNAPSQIVEWQKGLERSMADGMSAQGDPIFTYVIPREWTNIQSGLRAYAAPPRFSTGYAAVRNRVGLLVETHSLKPFKTRVESTYRLLIEVLKYANAHGAELKRAVAKAEKETATLCDSKADTADYPVKFVPGEKTTIVEFLGYESKRVENTLSGGTYPKWDHTKLVKMTVPYYSEVLPSAFVRVPRYYLIPTEWTCAVDVLKAHGVKMARLKNDETLRVNRYRFTNVKFRDQPYEGRHTVSYTASDTLEEAIIPAGTWVIDTRQPLGKIAVHLLDPNAPDSFMSWGFFSSIFEQKEYFEEYAMAPIADEMAAKNPALREELKKLVMADTAFAKDTYRRLQFFYERSPWWDVRKNADPIARIYSAVTLAVVEEKPAPATKTKKGSKR